MPLPPLTIVESLIEQIDMLYFVFSLRGLIYINCKNNREDLFLRKAENYFLETKKLLTSFGKAKKLRYGTAN
jgi:hypothetical protein